MKKLMLSVFALAAVVLSANAQKSANGTGNAELLSQIAIDGSSITGNALGGTVVAGVLEFGKIGIGTANSVVTVSTAGARSLTSGDAGLTNITTTPSAAGFAVTGGAGLTYSLSVPANNVVTLTGSGPALKLQDFTSLSQSTTETLNGSGKDWFAVGASLEIPSAAIAGSYTGTFQVVVNYN